MVPGRSRARHRRQPPSSSLGELDRLVYFARRHPLVAQRDAMIRVLTFDLAQTLRAKLELNQASELADGPACRRHPVDATLTAPRGEVK